MSDMSAKPRPEAVQAAAWWASRLGNAHHDLGTRDADERELTASVNLLGALADRTFTDEQRDTFRRELAMTIEEHLTRWETGVNEGAWRPENPQWGSALRCFGCDYHADGVLTDAAERAQIRLKSTDLPMKTVMWVNPGEVKVSEGYGAPIEAVWTESSPAP